MNNTSDGPTTSIEDSCLANRKWYIFLLSSLISFAAGLIIILFVRVTTYLLKKRCFCPPKKSHQSPIISESRTSNNVSNKHVERCKDGYRMVKRVCQGLVSGETKLGKIVLSISCFCSVGSFVIYLIQASDRNTEVEICTPWKSASIFDFAFNSFFFIFFVLRFFAAESKLTMWLELNSLVDFATIPPAAVALTIKRDWLGLRFMRAYRLINIPDLLQFLRVLRTGNLIRFAQLISIFISVWFSAAGVVQLLEISGDPWLDFENASPIGYWTCIYFIMVTMSTVGYGDITCHTVLGRGFIVLFILSAIAMFASFIPEIVTIVGNRKRRFKAVFKKEVGMRHVVICGNITYESVQNFIRDFLHEDRLVTNIKLVFVDSNKLDLELEALFKRYFTKLVYIRGSIMNKKDLNRVLLSEAEACLIMADQKCGDLEGQDAANIMRVISVKNFKPNTRIILQLMRFQNKEFCINLPTWDRYRDQIICISELKLGFMASACLAPGFSTLVANLIVMLSYNKNNDTWLDEYLKGAGMEIYTEKFSSAFYTRPFPAVAEICFSKLQLLLVAVCDEKSRRTHLNPGPNLKITRNMIGFFVCQSQAEASRVGTYCPFCDEYRGHKCNCTDDKKFENAIELFKKSAFESYRINKHISRLDEFSSNHCQLAITDAPPTLNHELHPLPNPLNLPYVSRGADLSPPAPAQLSTGSEDPGLAPNDIFLGLKDIFSAPTEECFDSTGHVHSCKHRDLSETVLSFRGNKHHLKNLKDHVVLCCFSSAESYWLGLRNFIIPLRLSSFDSAELVPIVILTPSGTGVEKEWNSIGKFPLVFLYYGSALNHEDLLAVKIDRCSSCVILSTSEAIGTEAEVLVDKDAILCTLNIKTMFQDLTTQNIPIITELANESNVQFIDYDDDDDENNDFYTTQPFACGKTFTSGVLHTFMSTTFFNPQSFSLLHSLIMGEDQIAPNRDSNPRRLSVDQLTSVRSRCRIRLLAVTAAPLVQYYSDTYGDLFVKSLVHLGYLCIGLFRLLDRTQLTDPLQPLTVGRFVYTNPPPNEKIYPSDYCYCFEPHKSTDESNQFDPTIPTNMTDATRV